MSGNEGTIGFILADHIPPCPLMKIAWCDCIMWAVTDRELMKMFTADTGVISPRDGSPIELLIDKATGLDEDFVAAFVPWFNANIWGDINLRAGGK